MVTHLRWLLVILGLSVFCAWVIVPKSEDFVLDFDDNGQPDIQILGQQPLGLDLVGGLRVLLEAAVDPSTFTVEDLAETANNVGRRINALGLSEATVQVQGTTRILVEIPGETDRQRAIETIQQTALLEFVDFAGISGVTFQDKHILTTAQLELGLQDPAQSTYERNPNTGQAFVTGMTGECLQAASSQYAANAMGIPSYQIAFEVRSDCVAQFSDLTARLIGQPMAIVLDGLVISAPTVQSQLSTGGVITGQFTQAESDQLALQLRSGALRIPLREESTVQVGATLGQQFLDQTIKAGVVGALVVFAFMLIYYRVPGVAADLALIVFILLNLALYKLLPVTLTLPAITGFLISIGTAVDGNILIFERVKEELRAGKGIREALDTGFDRAWASIRDSNLSTIIICIVLFLFGQNPGASVVSGFAVTLAMGLIVNLFTAIIVTRTFLYLLTSPIAKHLAERKWLLGV
jgi:protein-export membrane protein SecD